MSRDIYTYCIELLSRRAYSTFKLQKKLKEKKFPANEIDIVLKILLAEKYLRDDLYAEARVRTWMSKGHSASQIEKLLRQEKLALPIARIREIFDESDKTEDHQITVLVKTQMRKLRSIPNEPKELFKLKQKMTASLARKGHRFSAIRSAIERELSILSPK